MIKDDYNDVPVEYCSVCTSLNIRQLEGSNIIYCGNCGNPNSIIKDNINVWLVENSNFKRIDRLPEISNWRFDTNGNKYHYFTYKDSIQKERILRILEIFTVNYPKYVVQEEGEDKIKITKHVKC